MTTWIAVLMLGGLVGLDGTSFPQAMISRPIIAGALTGAIFGRPVEGLALGFIIEAFALVILPIGAAEVPESSTATVAATAAVLAATPAGPDTAYLALGVAFTLAWERLAGRSMVLHRQRNGRFLVSPGAVSAAQLERRHLAAMTMDFVRGAVLAGTGAVIALALLRALGPLWGLSPSLTVGSLMVLTAGMVGAAVPLFGGIRARRWAVTVGAALGALVAVVLR